MTQICSHLVNDWWKPYIGSVIKAWLQSRGLWDRYGDVLCLHASHQEIDVYSVLTTDRIILVLGKIFPGMPGLGMSTPNQLIFPDY